MLGVGQAKYMSASGPSPVKVATMKAAVRHHSKRAAPVNTDRPITYRIITLDPD